MKLSKLKFVSLHLLLILIFAITISAQDNPVMLNGTLFGSPPDNQEIFEVWRDPGYSDILGRPVKMLLNSKSEILIWSDAGHLVRMDQNGKILTLNRNFSLSHSAVIHNEVLYVFDANQKKGKTSYYLKKFDESGRYTSSLALKGGPDEFGGELHIGKNGEILLIERITKSYDKYTSYVDTRIIQFNKNGKFVRSWGANESFPEETAYLYSFQITRKNTLIAWYHNDKEIVTFDLQGNVIDRFTPGFYPAAIRINPVGNIVTFESSTQTVHTYDLAGGFLSEFTLNDQKSIYRDEFMAFDKSGNIYTFIVSKLRIRKYDSNGIFIKNIASTDDLIFPSKNLSTVKKTYSADFMDIGPEGKLYALFSDEKKVNVLSSDGKLVKSFKLKRKNPFFRGMRVRDDGSILALTMNHIAVYSNRGRLLKKWSPIVNPVDFDLAPDGSVYVITQQWPGDARLIKFSKEGEVMFDQQKWGTAEGNFQFPDSIAVSSNGEVHIINDKRKIDIFNAKGKFKRSIKLDIYVDRIGFNRDDNYILTGYLGAYIANPGGDIVSSFTGKLFTNSLQMLQNSKGRYFVRSLYESGGIFSFNNSKPFTKKGAKGVIKGQIKLKSENISKFFGTQVYLEGSTSAGRKFHCITEVDSAGRYSFKDVPVNSKYKIWTEDLGLSFSKLNTSVYTGTLKTESLARNFVSRTLPANYVRIFGIVKNKAGIPVNGVIITCGDSKSITSLNGRYCIAVPGNSIYVIRAEKGDYNFASSPRPLSLKTNDKLYVNFKEK